MAVGESEYDGEYEAEPEDDEDSDDDDPEVDPFVSESTPVADPDGLIVTPAAWHTGTSTLATSERTAEASADALSRTSDADADADACNLAKAAVIAAATAGGASALMDSNSVFNSAAFSPLLSSAVWILAQACAVDCLAALAALLRFDAAPPAPPEPQAANDSTLRAPAATNTTFFMMRPSSTRPTMPDNLQSYGRAHYPHLMSGLVEPIQVHDFRPGGREVLGEALDGVV